MAWTSEQMDAINMDNTNIIVSAGAGSGKTAVLTERVLRKIKDGVHIDELLIMTFTNAAAKEMKERIRKALIKNGYMKEADIVDSSYITTFDSFSLTLVKKYNYLLGVPKNISITDEAIINIEQVNIINSIFDEYYSDNNIKFHKFISDFCYKDDDEIKNQLLKLYKKLELKIDAIPYLENYINNTYNDETINQSITNYFKLIKKKIDYIDSLVLNLSDYFPSELIEKLNDILLPLYSSKRYDDVVKCDVNISSVRAPKGSLDDAKNIKNKISITLKEIKNMCIYNDEEEIKQEILATKDNASIIVEILLKLFEKMTSLKNEKNIYSFNDISLLAIKLVEDNSSVRNEFKNKFNEIMIDEYQDTNDMQEYFISLISNNNVYMVGDIKQSIYRFRNANPYIFKSKYDLYSDGLEGIKIDLLKNFRSRCEVLDNINYIFNELMYDDVGGADYKKSHQMNFGLEVYEKEKTTQSYDLDVFTYSNEDKKYTNTEKEAFIIANDIKEKIDASYMVFDKFTNKLRLATYNDFVILIDRSTDFDLYKKIFEYIGVPVLLYKDEEIKSDDDILVIRNILKLVEAIDQEREDNQFKYSFLSLARSFLFSYSDKDILNIFVSNSFKSTDIYDKCLELYNYYYEVSPKVFLLKLLEIFNYEENMISLTNTRILRKRLEYFYNLLEQFENDGKTVTDFVNYLDIILDGDNKSRFSLNSFNTEAVKIMTIHKSKGLEYPVCYFSGFKKEFSFKELNDLILYDNEFGIVIPYFNNYIKDTIYKFMLKDKTRIEEVSEKIRLLYVALTRAREKMIIVMPEIDNDVTYNFEDIIKSKSFYDMLRCVYNEISKYIKHKDMQYSKDYLITSSKIDISKLNVGDKINTWEYEFNYDLVEESKFSKNVSKIILKEEKEKMDFGSKIHKILEFIDFKNPNYDLIDKRYRSKISSFISSSVIQDNLDAKFYKEYEFVYLEDNIEKKGIIDLMIESDDEIIIIDYKLKDISDLNYDNQLNGYKMAIEKLSDKPISIYLYSIIDEKFRKL